MLERYFIKPDTIDGIRASWIGEPIEQYVTWLAEQGYSYRTITRRVPILKQFGEFTQQRETSDWSELPSHIEAFVGQWVKTHAKNTRQAVRWVANDARTPIEQMLSLILPDFQGSGRRRVTQDPFMDQAPGFFDYLREERGLKKKSLLYCGHHLRCLEGYLTHIGLSPLAELTPAVLSAFIVQSSSRLSKHSMTGLCSALRVFLRYLHREQLIGRDLSATVEAPRQYQLADVPRAISWDDVRRMFEVVDRRTPIGKRDYAMLLLLVTYGLRGHEVAQLTLDHIDYGSSCWCRSERQTTPLLTLSHP